MILRPLLAFLVLSVLIAGLLEPARAAQSSPTAGRTFTAEDRACGAFAEEQLAGDIGFSQESIEVLAGCRRTTRGDWFVPTGPDDSRLPSGPPLTADEAAATAELRRTLVAQLAAFQSVLAQTSYYGPSFATVLGDMKARLRPPYKTLEYRNRQLYRSVQGPYEEILVSFIADPDHTALGDYVAWWMRRRQAATPPNLSMRVNPMALTALLDRWDFTRAPWPWELTDPLTLDEYLDWALANGRVPVATTQRGATGGPSATECTEIALWMGETLQRRRQASTIVNNIGQTPFPDEQAAQGFEENAGALALLATEQEESDPPPAAVALNAVLVQEYETYAQGNTLLAEAHRTGDRAMSEAGWTTRQEAQEYGAAAAEMIGKLEVTCSLGAFVSRDVISTSAVAASTPPGGDPEAQMYPLSIHIVDWLGTLLSGACVEVVMAPGTSTICDNDQADASATDGIIEVRGSPGTYTVRETQAPVGYAQVQGTRTVTMTAHRATVVLLHEEL